MKKTILFAILIVCCLTNLSQASAKIQKEIVSAEQVDALRKAVAKKYNYKEVIYPFVLVGDIVSKLNHGNVNGLLRNWNKIPSSKRLKILAMFKKAKLNRFVFLMFVESGADPSLVSYAGARGLFQIMPATAKAICGVAKEELLDPVTNAQCAIKVLIKYGAKENWRWALVKYNGKYESCPAKGYMRCLHDKYLAGNKKLYGAVHYQAHFLIYSEMGRRFIWDWEDSRLTSK